jgi:Ca2+-binding RTX toxin-like protein
VGGTVSSYSNYKNFSLEYSVTSTNPVPALLVYSYLQNGDAVGLQTYILSGADQITGSNSNDVLAGRDGNDRIDGGLGNDTIYGQTGNDVILFSSGTDYVFGDSGADTLEVSSFAARFSVGRSDQNYFFVRELSSSNTTFLNGIERVKFLDFSVGLDNQVGGPRDSHTAFTRPLLIVPPIFPDLATGFRHLMPEWRESRSHPVL